MVSKQKTVDNCFCDAKSTEQGGTARECIERDVATMRMDWDASEARYQKIKY